MKTKSQKIISVFLSLLMTFMCLNVSVANADFKLPEKVNATSRMMLYFKAVEASAGQDIQIDMYASNMIAMKSLENLRITIPNGFEVIGMDQTSPAFNGTVTYELKDNYLNFNISSNGTINADEKVTSVYIHVSENCTAGKHDFQWSTSSLDCTTADGKNYTPTLIFGRVTVGDSVGTTTAPTQTTTQTTTTTAIYLETLDLEIASLPNKTVYQIGEELDLSGILYRITQKMSDGTNGSTEKSVQTDTSEFDNTKAGTYKIYASIEIDGLRAETSFEVTVEEPQTTTTTTITETTTTTTTTVSAYIDITINSYPTKTAYTVGEELDLSGGMFQSQGMWANGVRFGNSPSRMENSSNVDTSEFDSTKAGTYKIYIRVSEEDMTAETFFEVTVTEPETLEIVISHYPNKTAYMVGEELDLSGGLFYYKKSNAPNSMVFRMQDSEYVDTSEFDNTKVGTYNIFIKINQDGLYDETFFEVTVSEPQTTTTTETTTTETTNTTATTKHTYSVYFVDEESGQAVSGVRYNIVSYDYAHDLAQTIQTSGESPKSYEFISDTAYVSLTSLEQAIPDGYSVSDGADRWELSAENPNLTVYLRKSENTTIPAHMEVIIDSYPTKTAYTVGEELDLSGGAFHSEGTDSNGNGFSSVNNNMENNDKVDTSEFDSSKAGTYRIYVRMQYEELSAENYFEVIVSENTVNISLGDVNKDGLVDAVDSSLVLTEYALLSTGNGTGEFTDEQNTLADLNKDGEVNASDATLISMYYAYLSTGSDTKDSIDVWLDNIE
ncbi:MAG: bacterial Ig-like domain-containing protein [Ruminococcus flavefaciens]|nr:bacterial Ig-like domain-containing protein [Ruminococcus flavefaciens]